MVCGHGRVVDVEMRDGLELLKPQSFGGAVQDHHVLEEVRRCPTLPHPTECSTIGAEGLSFRVRNVTGRFPLRYNHRNTMKHINPSWRVYCFRITQGREH